MSTFSITFCFAQSKTHPPPPKPEERFRTNKVKYSLQRRLSFYPLNECAQIQIVSFGLQLDSNQRTVEGNYQLPKLNDTVQVSKLDQTICLNLKQVDTLTDILYNECARWTIAEYTQTGCYYPRNAILFIDKLGKVFEYMEICFECLQVKVSSSNAVKPDLCRYMYADLKSFYERNGLMTSSHELKGSLK